MRTLRPQRAELRRTDTEVPQNARIVVVELGVAEAHQPAEDALVGRAEAHEEAHRTVHDNPRNNVVNHCPVRVREDNYRNPNNKPDSAGLRNTENAGIPRTRG